MPQGMRKVEDDLLQDDARVADADAQRVACRLVDVERRFVDGEGVANAPSSIWTLYLVSVFVFSPMRKSRSAWSGKVGST